MYVRIRDGEVDDVQLRIYEPPRFFEALPARPRLHASRRHHRAHLRDLPGRLPDERLRGDRGRLRRRRSTAPIRALRRLSTAASGSRATRCTSSCSTRPTSSATTSAIEMARDHREIVERGLQIKKAGNELIRVVGGREIHPVNVRVGGFYRAPAPARAARAVEQLERARELALETVRWTGGLDVPGLRAGLRVRRAVRPRTTTRSSAGGSSRPAGSTSRPASTRSTSSRSTSQHSTALHSRLRERGAYLVRAARPLRAQLGPALAARARGGGRGRASAPVCRNPFRSIVVRSVEILYALDEALRIIDGYERARRARRRRRARAPASAAAGPRRRAACSGTATGSTRTARSSRPRSSRPPRRTRRRSRTTCAASWPATSTSTTTGCATAASRRSATTTPASPARRTSSTLEVDRG